MMNIVGQLFIQYEKEIDESNQILKSYEGFFGDDKVNNDILNKVFENNLKDNVYSDKDELY